MSSTPGHLCSVAGWRFDDGKTDEKGTERTDEYDGIAMDCLTTIDCYISDFLRNIESSRIRTLDGAVLVCAYWNLLGIHRIQRWFQSEICCTFHGLTLFEVIPLAGWRTSWLRTCHFAYLLINFDFVYWFIKLVFNVNRWKGVRWLVCSFTYECHHC